MHPKYLLPLRLTDRQPTETSGQTGEAVRVWPAQTPPD